MHGYYRPLRRGSKAEVNPDPWQPKPVVDAMRDPSFRAREAALLRAVGVKYPDLCIGGWGCPTAEVCGPLCQVCPQGRRGRPIESYGPAFACPNPDADQVVAFALVRRWMLRLPRTKTPRGNSYAWKHIAERENYPFYIANGTCIAAAIEAGVPQRREEGNSPNSLLALKSPPIDFEWRIWPGSRIVELPEVLV